jgi:SAM-dependent methyltransferase
MGFRLCDVEHDPTSDHDQMVVRMTKLVNPKARVPSAPESVSIPPPMQPPFEPKTLLASPLVQRALRSASDWIDLQWSLLWALLARIAPQARGRLLDVGCGQKPYEALFRPYVKEYLGIEHEATFERTRASMSDQQPDLYYDGRRLPFDDRTFDTVLSVQVLEHTPEPGLLLSEMARVLRADGILILSAPFDFRLHEEPHDYFRYTPHGLRALCDQAGLEIVELHKHGGLWSIVAHKLNSYLALRVARAGGLAQAVGKLSHEEPAKASLRAWTLPFVAPLMLSLAGGARVLDRVLPEPDEGLGFLIVARHRSR